MLEKITLRLAKTAHLMCRSGMQDTPLEATHWGRWARQLPLRSAVPLLVTPPVVGGVLVGALRAVSSFDDPAAADSSSGAASTEAALRDRTASASTSGRGEGSSALGGSPLWWAKQKACHCPDAVPKPPWVTLA